MTIAEPTWAPMMKVSWYARIREGAISFLALVALVSILFVADYRMREQATRVVAAVSPAGIAQTGAELTANASKLVTDARNQGQQHAPLAAFMMTAGVLLLFMLKS